MRDTRDEIVLEKRLLLLSACSGDFARKLERQARVRLWVARRALPLRLVLWPVVDWLQR